ncbi:hypothetical protein DVU_2115 [Nitratidesulfovibrio vulgaris str. Hildenborough]|uniref:Uncharacterized protein n=1 Tax=Nitratidesulfovibrio vulgaris (strain ATCC 29579 / DSM 644 / CCUG 34227 / NCIMB 8303 / VKM B-1760 / Hildenborough) TaxID=882 RepID=Q72A82_NITV2|nr:hypothetical protein DVU_2115 [Nitratidesulfovibrio vulgaris str. Hildenborough]
MSNPHAKRDRKDMLLHNMLFRMFFFGRGDGRDVPRRPSVPEGATFCLRSVDYGRVVRGGTAER